mgnify:CR=1 FL=1
MKHLIGVLIVCCLASVSQADLYTFVMTNQDGAVWDNQSIGYYTNSTLVATMYAYENGVGGWSNAGVMNSASSTFGINASWADTGTSTFDIWTAGNFGTEALWVSFNQDVTFQTIKVSSFGTAETGLLVVAASPLFFSANGTYTNSQTLSAGSFAVLSTVDMTSGNGWSLDNFTVETIPEPGTMAMLGMGLLGLALRRFRR